MNETETISGNVISVTYRNEENGYAVVLVKSGGKTVTCTGTLSFVSSGDDITLKGVWRNHKVYGRQFAAEECSVSEPETADGILRYLSSGAIKGIGTVTAAAIVSRFGENSLRVIENEPERLAQIRGISQSKAKQISEAYKSQYGLRETMQALSAFGVSPSESVEIFKVLGADAARAVTENPYIICREPLSMRFDLAEAIAAKQNIACNNIFRVMSAVLYVLRHNLLNGHTCIPRDKLISVSNNILDVNLDDIDIAIDNLEGSSEVTVFKSNGREYVALTKYYLAEKYIAGRISVSLSFASDGKTGCEKAISEVEKKLKIKYEDKQKTAIEYAATKGLVIVTGGPGTGKTTTLRGIIEILEQRGLKIALAAPTGRAAKRMEELTGREAKTVHRLLEVMWDERDRPYFARNERNPLSADAVIIDEISMVDSLLFEALLRALNPGCRLILVGDVCQLPSVGAGNIIGDLIDCGKIPTVTMTSIFRQASESAIITNAHKIVNGEYPDLRVKNSDFFFLNFENPSQAAAAVRDLCAKRLPEAYGYSALSDIQVLCPSKKLRTGTAELNNILQSVLNPACESKPQLNFEGYCLRLGDKVMQIKNNYQIPFTKEDGMVSSGVFNGDIGIVSKFDSKNCTLFVTYDDRIAEYGFEEASDLELAYAVTVHKSQGNEYPCVVIPLCSVPGPLCFRNLLYTAVTRAKQKLIIVGSEAVIKRMVENDRKTLRYTCLKHLLEEI